MSIAPNDTIAALSAYKPGPRRPDISLFLDGNEGRTPADFHTRLSALRDLPASQYPNTLALERVFAERLGVAPDRVLVTAGADGAIDRVCRSVLAPGRNALMAAPTFVMLARYIALAGGTLRTVPWLRQAYPLEAVIDSADRATALVTVVSPQNPTGGVVDGEALRTLRERIPQALLLVDLAYGELADVDLTEIALSLPDTVVLRTLSKAWGLAGLRIGYAAGPANIIDWLRRVGHPYAVAAPSIALAMAQLGDEGHMRAYVARVRKERAALYQLLDRLECQPLPSQGNFVLCEPKDPLPLVAGLAERGIAVRSWPGLPELSAFVRITCPGDGSDMARLCGALEEVLG